MKTTPSFIVILFFIFIPRTHACPFKDLSHADLTNTNSFVVLETKSIPFPDHLFTAFSDHLGEFNKSECANAAHEKKLLYKPTNVLYSMYYTDQELCDGGNTYGLIIQQSPHDSNNVIATIEDSFIYCLP